MLQLNITEAIQREPDPWRVAKLESYIAESLRKCEGQPQTAFLHLIGLAEKESELENLIADVMAVALLRYFNRTAEHLSRN
jgi:hypothetical protein